MSPTCYTCTLPKAAMFMLLNILLLSGGLQSGIKVERHLNLTNDGIILSADSNSSSLLTPCSGTTDSTTLNVTHSSCGATPTKDAFFYRNFCSHRCDGDVQFNDRSLVACLDNQFKCFPCDCIKPKCQVYGTCCPSVNDSETPTQSSDAVVKCDTSAKDISFLYIRSCPKHFSDENVKELCLGDIPAEEQTTESFVRAHDNSTGIVYYNKFCAVCNNVTLPTMWNVTITCEHFLKVYAATTQEELLRLSLGADSTCQVVQNVPSSVDPYRCKRKWFGDVIDSCNITGQWSGTEDNVINQCERNTNRHNVAARVSGSTNGTYYKNVFCALCNSEPRLSDIYRGLTESTDQTCIYIVSNFVDNDNSIPKRVLPFSLLLGSARGNLNAEKPDSVLKLTNCTILEWSSPDNRCLPLKCMPGKYLNNGKCSTSLNNIRGLGYSTSVVYKTQKTLTNQTERDDTSPNESNSSKLIENLVKHFQQVFILDRAFVETELALNFVQKVNNFNHTERSDRPLGSNFKSLSTTLPAQTDHTDLLVYLKVSVLANESISRDDFEQYLLSTLLLNVTELQEGGNYTIAQSPLFVPDVPEMATCLNKTPEIENQTSNLQITTLDIVEKTNKTVWNYTGSFLSLIPVLTCAHVPFNQTEYCISVYCVTFQPTWQISLSLGQVTLTFSGVTDLNRLAVSGTNESGDGQLKVCVDLLEEKVEELKNRRRPLRFEESAVYLWQYYLSHVCLGLSMICLLITLLTFSLLPTLRNNAGTNNMFLSGTILLAQASLLSSVHVDGPSSLCTVIGICTHFLWLSVTCWSFICCLHMFRVFTAKTGVTQSSAASRQISLIKKVLASILAPAVVIATVMASSYLTSGGQRIGYTDSNPCYLDSSFVTSLSLVAPLGVVCVVNVGFFVYTIYRIHQVTMLQAHSNVKKPEFQIFFIYIKLSTLTGSFWIVGIVSETTNCDPLRFVAIILNGLQGVFLFLSLVCNKRVFRACKKPLFGEPGSSLATVSSSAGAFHKVTGDVSVAPP